MFSTDLIIVAAMTADRVIGRKERLPWDIPADLALFRRLTMGHCLVMGRKTYESIGRPLPGRTNIVVSGTMDPVPGVIVCRDFAGAVQRSLQQGCKVFFIGGREIYRQALAVAGRMYISWVKENYEGDCRFPPFRQSAWVIEEERDFGAFRRVVYRRREISDVRA